MTNQISQATRFLINSAITNKRYAPYNQQQAQNDIISLCLTRSGCRRRIMETELSECTSYLNVYWYFENHVVLMLTDD